MIRALQDEGLLFLWVTGRAMELGRALLQHWAEGGAIEFSGRIKSLDPETRSGVVIIVAKSAGRKIFGLATMNVRFA